jgi:hypothetical protein
MSGRVSAEQLAAFITFGRLANREAASHEFAAPAQPLLIGPNQDLRTMVPETVKDAMEAAEGYKLFFVFENYLRKIVFSVLSEKFKEQWWEQVPEDIRTKVERLEEKEETKAWMDVTKRRQIDLLTFFELISIIERLWDQYFKELIQDNMLIEETRILVHLRNTICHMEPVPDTELERIRTAFRDWSRIVPA